VLPLLALWGVLIDHLRLEWTVNPQYTYGWAVPLLCLYLIWQKREWQMEDGGSAVAPRLDAPARFVQERGLRLLLWAACVLAALLLPTRLILEACSDWRTVSWVLALEVVGLTLIAVYWVGGRSLLRRMAFPICYFLVAVPWLSGVEGPVIRGLTRLNAALTVEVLNLLGQAAVQHGNVIEVSTGMVGIDEACAGIRSLQATLMIALFFGELYRRGAWSRVGLCLAGFGLAVLFNLGRTVLLSWVAATRGMDAISKWHDPAGVTILLSCFVGLWCIAALQRRVQRRSKREAVGTADAKGTASPSVGAAAPQSEAARSPRLLSRAAIGLAVWIAVVEVSVYWWYQSEGTHADRTLPWTVRLPREKPGFREIPLSETTWRFLRYDAALNASWTASDATAIQVVFLRWNPGRLARLAAKSHTPEICLAAAGNAPVADPEPVSVEVQGVTLPFKLFRITLQGRPAFVYYLLWADGMLNPVVQEDTYRSRFASVLGRVKGQGQCSLEVVVFGAADASQAEKSLRAELRGIIKLSGRGDSGPSQPTEVKRSG
jgi:exosortase